MHAIERELIKVTGYKARTKFSDRQDYLSSILNAVSKLDDDDFDNLSDEAAEWANAAVEAKNSRNAELPDFDEVGTPEEAPDDSSDPEDEEGGEDGSADDENDSDADDDSDDVADASDDDASEDDEGDPTDDNPEDDDDADDDEDAEADDEDEPEEKPAKKAAPKKAAKPAPAPKLKPPPKPKKAAAKPPKQNDVEEDVVLDKWGCMEGSKNSQALSIFEKGATAKEVKEQLGGTYYNILKRMAEQGHSVEKEGAVIKVTHKDAKKAPVKKAKK